MKKWYHIHKGQTYGPLTQEEIELKISESEIGPMDLLYIEGALGWRPASEWSEFKLNFDAGSSLPIKNEWIILVKKDKEFGQAGPYREDQIIEKIRTKELTFDDHVWREGMQEWYKIASLPNFNPARQSTIKFEDKGPELKIEQIYNEEASTLLKNVKVLGQKKALEKTSSINSTFEFMKSTSPFHANSGTESDNNNEKQEKKSHGASKSKTAGVGEQINKLLEAHNIEKTLIARTAKPGQESLRGVQETKAPLLSKSTQRVEESTPSVKQQQGGPHGETEPSISKQKIDELKRSLDELASGLKIGTKSKKLSGNAEVPTETRGESRRTTAKVEVSNEEDLEATQILSSDELTIVDDKPGKAMSRNSHPIVKIIDKDNKSTGRKKPSSFFSAIFREVNALFPKGSWLRFVGLFLLVFVTAVFILISSFQDKGKSHKAQVEIDVKVKEAKLKERLKRKKEKQKRLKIAEIENANRRIKPSVFKLYAKETNGTKGRLDLYTNASAHYKFEILIFGEAGKVLSDRSFYKYMVRPAEENLILYFEQLKMPPGFYKVWVKIGGLQKETSFFKGEKNKSFLLRRGRHRKTISVWHQKEKRALYSTVTRLKDLSMQVSSLVGLRTKNKVRWKRAVSNWSKKFKAGESNYLSRLTKGNAGQLTHPLMWLTLKDFSNEVLESGNSEASTSTNFNDIIARLISFEREVQRLSLW